MMKPNGEIVPPLKCATCPIASGCAWECLRADDLIEIYELRAMVNGRAHRVMTPEEYASMKIEGWHMVQRNYDNAGNVAVRFIAT